MPVSSELNVRLKAKRDSVNKVSKKILYLFLLNVIGFAILALPLFGMYWGIRHKMLFLVPLNVLMFFFFRKVLFIIEDRIGIRSPSNPKSRYFGSGITFEAPWIRRQREKSTMKKNTTCEGEGVGVGPR